MTSGPKQKKTKAASLNVHLPGLLYHFQVLPDGSYQMPWANENLTEIFSVNPKDAARDVNLVLEKIHPDDLQMVKDAITRSAHSMKPWELEFRIRKEGSPDRWLSGLANPEKLKDGSVFWQGYIMDVTEKRKKELAASVSQTKYQRYFEATPDGLFVVNEKGDCLEANPAACCLTGYALNELLSLNITDLTHPSFRKAGLKTLTESLEKDSVDAEIVLRKKSGESAWVRLVTSKLGENEIIAFCKDITQKKFNAEALDAQLNFREIIANTSSRFVNTTFEALDKTVLQALEDTGRYFMADRSYVFLFSEDYALMSNTHEWCAQGIDPQRDALQEVATSQMLWWWEQMKNKKQVNIHDIGRDGRLTSFEKKALLQQNIKSLLCVPMISEGRLMGFLGLDRVKTQKGWSEEHSSQFNTLARIFSGVFAKYIAEKALRQSENRYRLLAENARDVIYRVAYDPAFRFDYVSFSIFHFTGYKPESFYSDPLLFQQVIFTDDLELAENVFSDSGKMNDMLRLRLKHKNQTVTWCEFSNVPVYDNNRLVAVEGIMRNVSQQKESEDKLLALNEELFEKKQALEALNSSLEKRVSEEVEKNRRMDHLMALQTRQAALGEMIGNIAHQWRQPLNLLSLAIYDLTDAFKYEELDADYLKNSVEEMHRIIQQMSKTIDDFRFYFKPQKEKSVFDAAKAIGQAMDFVQPYFRAAEIKVNKDLPAGIGILGYAGQFEQALINILKNAHDAMQELNPSERVLDIRLQRTPDECCRVEISNRGEAISEEDLPRLFDPYFSTKPEGQGLGLGLYIAKVVIEKNMEGSIWCENMPLGPRFVLNLRCPGETFAQE